MFHMKEKLEYHRNTKIKEKIKSNVIRKVNYKKVN